MAGARDVASMLNNEQLKCTDMLPLYIAFESAIKDQFFCVLATLKRKFNVLCLYIILIVLGTREDLSIDASITNVELIWTKLG